MNFNFTVLDITINPIIKLIKKAEFWIYAAGFLSGILFMSHGKAVTQELARLKDNQLAYFGFHWANSLSDEQRLWVNYDYASLREKPYTNAKVKHELPLGEEIIFTGQVSTHTIESVIDGKKRRAPWIYVKTVRGFEGWLFAASASRRTVGLQKGINFKTPDEFDAPQATHGKPEAKYITSNSRYVKDEGLNLRKGPGTNFSPLTKLAYGEVVTFLETTDKLELIRHCQNFEELPWVKIRTLGGVEGFVYSGCLSLNSIFPDALKEDDSFFEDIYNENKETMASTIKPPK